LHRTPHRPRARIPTSEVNEVEANGVKRIRLSGQAVNRMDRTSTARDIRLDLMGISYWNYWHGNLDDVSARYGKDPVVVDELPR
jgi:arabinogalactan endo-1,4-beta-galactosidase